jgi:hypothetical protein
MHTTRLRPGPLTGLAGAAGMLLCSVALAQAPTTAPAAAPPAAPAARAPARPAATAPVAAAPKPKPGTPKAGGRFSTVDNVELDRTTITGNRELPNVMVIVPWKRSDIGDLIGRPGNSLVDEALAPVDREVFRREVRYHSTLNPDAPPPAALAAPAIEPVK